MEPELRFDVLDWIGRADAGDPAVSTLGALTIEGGGVRPWVLTRVEDTLAASVRPHIRVPAVQLAEWLLVHWWRLRWESDSSRTETSWVYAHRMSSISRDVPWPALELSSDGESVQLRMEPEPMADVAGVRYLERVAVEVPARDFERAVDRFVAVVEQRLAQCTPGYRTLSELREELAEERRRPSLARECRWQARAGLAPGCADDAWVERARGLVHDLGAVSGEDALGTLSAGDHDLGKLERAIEAMKRSTTSLDLTWATLAERTTAAELPSERGSRLAKQLRAREKLGDGPLSNERLSDLVSAHLPLRGELVKNPLSGGYRNGVSGGRTRIVWGSTRVESQRFHIGRLLGEAHVLGPEEHLLPVSDAGTALQKLGRSFAQELLCPWEALDAYTDEHGLDDEALSDAAAHFEVSELLVRSTLVNRGKLDRWRITPRQ